MLSQIDALFYLESRQVKNFVKRAIHNPSRIIVWLLVVGWFAFTIYSRAKGGAGSTLAPGVATSLSTVFGFGALGLLFSGFIQGANGRVGSFSNAADARFLIGSHLSPQFVVFWLQLRNSAFTLLRISLAIVLNVVIFSHSNGTWTFLALSGLTALFTVTPLPIFELARRLPHHVVMRVATVLSIACFAGMALSVASLATPTVAPAMAILNHLEIGNAMALIWGGAHVAVALVWLAVVTIIVLGVAGAKDLYPELYSSTLTWAARWSRARGWNHLAQPKAGVQDVRSMNTPLRGVMVAFWKEQIAYMRSPGVRTMFLIELSVAVIAGAAAGILGRHNVDTLITIAGAAAAIIIMLLALSGTSLVHDISKPIWWLGSGSALAKLAAWSIATSLDSIVILLLGSVSLGIASGNISFGLLGMAMALLLPSFVRAIGVATYAFLPASIDQRGPVAILRSLMIYVLFAPPAALGIFLGILTSNAIVGTLLAMTATIIEGALALMLAARKIEGRGAEYATAEGS